MALTIVENTLTRKVFKPTRGYKDLYPSIPGFEEYAILNWRCQGACPTVEAHQYEFQKHIFDDKGLIIAIYQHYELRVDVANTILNLSTACMMMMDDFRLTDEDGPMPKTYHEAVAANQVYLYGQVKRENIYIPIIEDEEIYPWIDFSNVFGGADANAYWVIYLHYLKTK